MFTLFDYVCFTLTGFELNPQIGADLTVEDGEKLKQRETDADEGGKVEPV